MYSRVYSTINQMSSVSSFPPSNLKAFNRLNVTLNHLAGVSSRSSMGPSRSASYSTGSNYCTTVGSKYSQSYKNYAVSKEGEIVSYFHDLPLGLDPETKTANMVVEVPRWSNAKFEISTTLPGNPIVQDVKKGQVRFVKNIFPHHGYIHNYGAFPQTWENPSVESLVEGLYGDGDPLDVCEIGSTVLETGQTKRVKILGSLALVDDGELDWKVLVVSTDDPMAAKLSDIGDVHRECPGLLQATLQWFRDYKIPDGKGENKFALNGEYQNAEKTIETIIECHHEWKELVSGKSSRKDVSIENVTLEDSPKKLASFDFSNSVLGAKTEPHSEIPSEIPEFITFDSIYSVFKCFLKQGNEITSY